MKKKYIKKKAKRILKQINDILAFLYQTSFDVGTYYDSIDELAVQTIYLKTALHYIIKHFQEEGKILEMHFNQYSIPPGLPGEYGNDEEWMELIYDEGTADEFFGLFSEFGWECIPIQCFSPEIKKFLCSQFAPLPGEADFLKDMEESFACGAYGGTLYRMSCHRLENLWHYLYTHPEYASHIVVKAIQNTAPLVGNPFLWYTETCTAIFAQKYPESRNETPIYSCYYSFLGLDPYYDMETHPCHLNPFALKFAEFLEELLALAEKTFGYGENKK